MRRPPDDRPTVVQGIDAGRDIGEEEPPDLRGRQAVPPVPVVVVAGVMEPGGRDDVDTGPSADLRQREDVPTRVGGHRIDDRSQPERDSPPQLLDSLADVVEPKVGIELDGLAAGDREVLVAVRGPELRGIDVAEDRPDERHTGPGERDQPLASETPQPPSTPITWPVTAPVAAARSQTARSATSFASSTPRVSGCRRRVYSTVAGSCAARAAIGVSTSPGAIALNRSPSGA